MSEALAQIREARTTPAACAACLQAGPEKRYVDFSAAYDGPVLTLPDGRKQPIDDLILCERCLEQAFTILDPRGLRDTVESLTEENERLEILLEERERQIQRLGRTTGELAIHPVTPRGGSQGFSGIPDDVKKELNDRRKRQKARA